MVWLPDTIVVKSLDLADIQFYAAADTLRMSLIDSRHFQLKSGKILTLPAGLRTLDVHPDVYVASYNYRQGRESIFCSDIKNGRIIWSISKEPKTMCSLSIDGLSLKLENGVFNAQVPIVAIVQADGGFAVRAAGNVREDSAIFKLDSSGMICWVSDPVYSSVVLGSTPATVRGRAGEAVETLDMATGKVIDFRQGR